MSRPTQDGGPAFPVEVTYHSDEIISGVQTGPKSGWEHGMTIRDYFAGKVLQAEVWDWFEGGKSNDTVLRYQGIAEHCYMVADAMLAARSK